MKDFKIKNCLRKPSLENTLEMGKTRKSEDQIEINGVFYVLYPFVFSTMSDLRT